MRPGIGPVDGNIVDHGRHFVLPCLFARWRRRLDVRHLRARQDAVVDVVESDALVGGCRDLGQIGGDVLPRHGLLRIGRKRGARVRREFCGAFAIDGIGDGESTRHIGRLGIEVSRQVHRQQLHVGRPDRRGDGRLAHVGALAGVIDDLRACAQVGQAVAQRHQLCGQRGEYGNPRRRRLQGRHAAADRLRGVGQRGHAFRRGRLARGQQPLDVLFRRRGDVGDLGHVGHGQGAVHRVDGAQQLFADRRGLHLRLLQPGVDGVQVVVDFGFQDLAQYRVHRRRRTFGFRLEHGRHVLCDRSDVGGLDELLVLRQHRGFGAVVGVFAGGKTIGHALQAGQVCGHAALAAQCGVELRQRIAGLFQQRFDGVAGLARAVQHAVEHVLHLPAELAERLGAD